MSGRRAAMDLTSLWVAILAAYALVLQAVAPMMPAVAGVPGADVICRGGTADTGGSGTVPHAHDACLLHCLGSPVAAAGAGAPDLPAPRLASIPAARPLFADGAVAAAPRGFAQPRAPPSATA